MPKTLIPARETSGRKARAASVVSPPALPPLMAMPVRVHGAPRPTRNGAAATQSSTSTIPQAPRARR